MSNFFGGGKLPLILSVFYKICFSCLKNIWLNLELIVNHNLHITLRAAIWLAVTLTCVCFDWLSFAVNLLSNTYEYIQSSSHSNSCVLHETLAVVIMVRACVWYKIIIKLFVSMFVHRVSLTACLPAFYGWSGFVHRLTFLSLCLRCFFQWELVDCVDKTLQFLCLLLEFWLNIMSDKHTVVCVCASVYCKLIRFCFKNSCVVSVDVCISVCSFGFCEFVKSWFGLLSWVVWLIYVE